LSIPELNLKLLILPPRVESSLNPEWEAYSKHRSFLGDDRSEFLDNGGVLWNPRRRGRQEGEYVSKAG
jgi:hypothetical protein